MGEVSRNGRALPPRPSLLVGNVQECHAAWSKLRTEANSMLERERLAVQHHGEHAHGSSTQGSNSAAIPRPYGHDEWDSIVRRFRALRESLVSNYMTGDMIAVEVYELSTDVCAAAHNHPEFLKSLQGLVGALYPQQEAALTRAADRQQRQRQPGGTGASAPGPRPGAAASVAAAAAAGQPQQQQQEEGQQQRKRGGQALQFPASLESGAPAVRVSPATLPQQQASQQRPQEKQQQDWEAEQQQEEQQQEEQQQAASAEAEPSGPQGRKRGGTQIQFPNSLESGTPAAVSGGARRAQQQQPRPQSAPVTPAAAGAAGRGWQPAAGSPQLPDSGKGSGKSTWAAAMQAAAAAAAAAGAPGAAAAAATPPVAISTAGAVAHVRGVPRVAAAAPKASPRQAPKFLGPEPQQQQQRRPRQQGPPRQLRPYTPPADVDPPAAPLVSPRQPEMAAAQLLFFCCVPSKPSKQEVGEVLRGPPLRRHWGSAEVSYALEVCRALACSDFAAYFRAVAAAPTPLMHTLVTAKMGQMQKYALTASAATYRSLPMQAALPMLGWSHHAHVKADGSGGGRKSAQGGQPDGATAQKRLKGPCGTAAVAAPPDPQAADAASAARAITGLSLTSTGSGGAPQRGARGQAAPAAASVSVHADGSVILHDERLLARLLGVLRDAADSGCRGASTALEAAQVVPDGVLRELVFKG